MRTRKTKCLCVSGPDSAAAARPERCKGWSIGSALHMHPMHPMHHYMHPEHPMHPICTLVHMQGHHCAVLSGSRLSFGGCAQPSGYLVPALDPSRICIWCTIHYLEMQYLVQRDKGCELRHKGSVSPMAAAVRRWANIRVQHPVATFAHVLILSAEQDWQYLYMGSASTHA